MHRTYVKVLEDVLDANEHDRGREPRRLRPRGRDGGEPHERAGRRQDDAARAVAARPRRRAGRRARGRRASTLDADRIAHLHVPVVQIDTDPSFGGECHLDANMVRSAIPSLPLDELDLLVIENVGNLVCPAEFRVGEHHRVMVSSVAEGEDKPLKYPLMFRACELVIVNKIDLLPHLDFDLDRYLRNLDAVHPGVDRAARQREDRRGRRRVARLARARGDAGGQCRRDRGAHRRKRAVLRRRGGADRRALAAAGRAVRRTADGCSPSATRRRTARTRTTSRSSSSIP